MVRVSVGSQGAIDGIEGRFRSFVEDHIKAQTKWGRKAKAAFRERMHRVAAKAFKTVHENVVVNGHDWDYTLRDEGFAPRNRSLAASLKAVQLETQELVERVAASRRDVPMRIAAYAKEVAAAATRMQEKEGDASADVAVVDAAPVGVPGDLVERIDKVVGDIVALSKTLPEVLEKYENLAKVTADEERIRATRTEAAITGKELPEKS